MFVDPALAKVARSLRDDVAFPVIAVTSDHGGAARVREVEGQGLVASFAARLVPQVHGFLTPERLAMGAPLDGVDELWLDHQVYASDPQAVQSVSSPLVSSEQEVDARLRQRERLAGRPDTNTHLESYLGAMGPTEIPHEAAVVPVTQSRQFLDSDRVANEGFLAKDVKVAVIDTGVDGSHPMLKDAVTGHWSFVDEKPGLDKNGHGTWCASCVAGRPVEYRGRAKALNGTVLRGVADRAEVFDVKVLTGEGTGLTSGVVQGIEAAVERGVDVISMSLGSILGQAGRDPSSMAADEAARAGVRVVAASGNSFGYATVGSPASAPGAVAVGSVAMERPDAGAVSTFSSKGPTIDGRIKPDIAGPGGNLGSRGNVLNEVILGAASGTMAEESGERFAALRGTSMATPAVAGAFAQLVRPGLPQDRESLEALLSASVGGLAPVKSNREGWGVFDADRALGELPVTSRLSVRGFMIGAQTRRRPITGFLAERLAKRQDVPGPDPFSARVPLV